MGRRRKRHWKTAGILTAIFALSAGSLWYFLRVRSNAIDMEDQGLHSDNANIITAAGVTENGIDAVTFAIDFLEDTRLYVEDVYISKGDTVAAGEAYIKFTDDSIQKARAELEKAVQNTQLAYRSKVISNGEDKIQAKYTYDTAVLEAEYAPQVYQDTLTQLEMQLVKAQTAFEEAQQEYNAYYDAVANNTFYEDYQIETLKNAYEDAYALCTQRGKYYGVTEEELELLNDNSNGARAEQDDRQWIIRSVALLREEAKEAKAEYEQAKLDYQREIEGAELKLQILLNQFEIAQQCYTDAQLECQRGGVRAKTLYELTVARGQTAQSEYNASMISLADELERLGDARDEAVKNKELFEELIGDGYLYTEQAGTILGIYVAKGQEIVGGETILAYSNPEELFATVIMPEISAAKRFVGERAGVTIENHGSFDGVVKAILPATISDSGISTCNVVKVALMGNVSTIGSSLTAAVVFGENAQDQIVQCNAAAYQDAMHQTASQMYDLDFYECGVLAETDDAHAKYLNAAEIYVEAGQYLREGDAVCQFTQDSIECVRKALMRAQSDAHIALMKAQTNYHISVLEAGLLHNEAMTDAALAQTSYDNTIAKLNSAKVEKILRIESLLADIYQLQKALTDDSYQRQRTDIANAYEKAKKQVENAKECFVTSQIDAEQAFQAAKEAYEVFLSQFEESSQQIADKVDEVYAIQGEILQSQQFLEKELMTAEQARSAAEVEGETAKARYEMIVRENENAVNKAQTDLEQAVQRLDAFNQFVGDGTLYATENGMVMEVGYRNGDWIVDIGKLVIFMADADTHSLIEEGGKEDTQ